MFDDFKEHLKIQNHILTKKTKNRLTKINKNLL